MHVVGYPALSKERAGRRGAFSRSHGPDEAYIPAARREGRTYVLRPFVRPGLLSPEGTGQMCQRQHSGGSAPRCELRPVIGNRFLCTIIAYLC